MDTMAKEYYTASIRLESHQFTLMEPIETFKSKNDAIQYHFDRVGKNCKISAHTGHVYDEMKWPKNSTEREVYQILLGGGLGYLEYFAIYKIPREKETLSHYHRLKKLFDELGVIYETHVSPDPIQPWPYRICIRKKDDSQILCFSFFFSREENFGYTIFGE